MQLFPAMATDPNNRFTALRKAAGFKSQTALADFVGVHSQAICQIENGKKGVSFPLARKIAAAFGVGMEHLPVRILPGDASPPGTSDAPRVSLLRGSVLFVGDEARVEMATGDLAREWVPSEGVPADAQWYRVDTDDLVSARLNRGDRLSVESEAPLHDGCKVLVAFQPDQAGTPVYYLKVWRDGGFLEPVTRKSPRIVLDETWRIVGKVTWILRREQA